MKHSLSHLHVFFLLPLSLYWWKNLVPFGWRRTCNVSWHHSLQLHWITSTGGSFLRGSGRCGDHHVDVTGSCISWLEVAWYLELEMRIEDEIHIA